MAAKQKKSYILAKSDDGGVQVTFTISSKQIDKAKDQVVAGLGKDMEIPGFRKGKAPKHKILENIQREKLINEILARILPKMLADVIRTEKLKLAIYPKFELIKAKDGEDWQVRGVSAQVPKFSLGDYKKYVASSKSSEIWTPEKGKSKEKSKELTREEKESRILRSLLENIKIKIPHILIDEEVNRRLSQLLERIEKLGLNLDSYLASVGKTPEKIREEYHAQAESAIALELILSKIAEKEGISISDEKIDETIKVSTPEKEVESVLKNQDRRSIVRSVLKRRAVIDSLVALV